MSIPANYAHFLVIVCHNCYIISVIRRGLGPILTPSSALPARRAAQEIFHLNG